MVASVLLLLLGVGLLLVGGAALIRGASGFAAGLGVPPLVVGLTVVAFGTSAPELVVTMLAALEGESHLAFGNVVGSNIANMALVLGCAALIAPVAIQGQIIRRELPLLLLGTLMLLVMSLDSLLRGADALLDRGDSLVLMLLFSVFVYIMVLDFLRRDGDPLMESVEHLTLPDLTLSGHMRNATFTAAGIVGLAIGGQLTIATGVELAEQLHLSVVLVGLFAVAIGTSLPELVTSVMAAVQREPDLCVGNVVGSNLMNGLLVLPLGALMRPFEIPPGGIFDLLMSLLFAALLLPIFYFGQRRMSRLAGAAMLLGYGVFLAVRINLQ